MERIRLNGSVHPLAQPQFDQGPADPDLRLDLITLVLKMTPQQQADLDSLLKDLQDRTSPRYHRWLTPEQYADRFGVSAPDLEKISGWLAASGFRVQQVSRTRDSIVFSGTAGQVESALHTQIHRYVVKGERHFANAGPAEVPAALQELVLGFRGLHDFQPKLRPRRGNFPAAQRSAGGPQPQVIIDKSGINYLAPDDLAAIYDISNVYAHGWDGSGQLIAIAGASDIDMSDIETFRQIFNLPFNDPVPLLASPSPRPGKNGAMGEADLDLEWAGAIAPGAQIVYVYSVDPFYSAFYAIDNNVAPVLSTSFGVCEWHLVPDDFHLFHSYSLKAAAMGITWLSSSGDSGAAGCESQEGGWTFATTRLSVDMPASMPEVVAVGGTEFNEGKTSYWSSSPGPNGGTATGYIPEAAWNDENLIMADIGQGTLKTMGPGFSSGGGGASLWFGKPQWQAGPGVPKDGARDVPDLALTASGSHDPYSVISGGNLEPIGGTSASAPVFAGIVALLNQYLVGQNIQADPGVGNMNPMLYYLAQNSTGIFHDVTVGGNQVPCVPGSTQDCGNSAIYGYAAGPGFDLATGWGSVDAGALIGTWAKVVMQTPRLVITTYTASTQLAAGGPFTMKIVVTNQGGADAGPFQIRSTFTTDGTQATAKNWWAECDMSGAAAGQSVTCSGTLNLGSAITPGTYILLGIADANNQVAQPDRTGNTAFASTGPLTVTR